jgi:NADPH2:quinone reductase
LLVLPDNVDLNRRRHDAARPDGAVPVPPHRAAEAGDTILFHAAAGGVGLIACQWARVMGVT